MIREDEMKAVFWGTGKEHSAQLFNLTADPDEHHNLAVGYLHHALIPMCTEPCLVGS
jgi:hypothetical protein